MVGGKHLIKLEACKICCEISLIPNESGNGFIPEIFYECDPNKNTECKKTICFMNGGECYLTEYIELAKRKGLYD